MKITEVRIKLMDEPGERLKAFCSITFDDCFVIRDLKIIDGTSGFFVAMPSRKLTSHCPVCRYKNPIRASFCNQCGAKLPMQTPTRDEDGRAKLYADIAHPINSAAREMIQREVIAAYEEEKVRAQAPGYVSRYDEFDLDFDDEQSMNDFRVPNGRTSSPSPYPQAPMGQNLYYPYPGQTPYPAPNPYVNQGPYAPYPGQNPYPGQAPYLGQTPYPNPYAVSPRGRQPVYQQPPMSQSLQQPQPSQIPTQPQTKSSVASQPSAPAQSVQSAPQKEQVQEVQENQSGDFGAGIFD